MKGNHKDNDRIQPEQGPRTWNVILDGEIIGLVHGQTEAQARDIVAPFQINLQVVAAE